MSQKEVIIIGTGPAGISAALTLQARQKDFLLFGTPALSGKIRAAEHIANYPGLANVSGERLAAAFSDQLRTAGISVTPKTVTGVYEWEDGYAVVCDQEMFETKSVILATGVESVKPIAGELEFLGRGVSYCATCDGMLYQGKTIAVVCTDKEMEHEIRFLADIAKEVYLVPLYREAGIFPENTQIIRAMPKAIVGTRRAEKLLFSDKEIAVDGVFMLKRAVSPAVLVGGIETLDGHIVVDRACRTNLAGIFAAGDCTGRPYQYAKAVGEGNVAAHSAMDYCAAAKA